jgi:hypothetical protein
MVAFAAGKLTAGGKCSLIDEDGLLLCAQA